MGGKCIRCDFPHILVSKTFSGKVKVELLVYGRPDGTVYLAEVKDTPDKEVGEELAKAAQGWIFYPYMKDGVAISTRRPVKLDVQVIKND
jgi:hypothetical protein